MSSGQLYPLRYQVGLCLIDLAFMNTQLVDFIVTVYFLIKPGLYFGCNVKEHFKYATKISLLDNSLT